MYVCMYVVHYAAVPAIEVRELRGLRLVALLAETVTNLLLLNP